MNKKSILTISIALLFCITAVTAQNRIAEIWTQPAVFNADEAVSFFFDLTGTELAEVANDEGVCVWTWFPSDPGETWGNPSDASTLSHVEGNIWRWDLVPTDFYKLEAGAINEFYGQLQTHAGTHICLFAPDQEPPNHIVRYSLVTIKDGDEIIDYYPKDFTSNKPLSVLLNTNNTWPDNCDNDPAQGELANAPNVHVHSGVNNWAIVIENNPSNVNQTALTHLGDNIYRWDFIPAEYFGFNDDFNLENINMVFASNDWSYVGKNVNCTDFAIQAPDIPEPANPELSFFPSKISAKDILVISRKNNEPYVNSLSYSIVAENTSFSGNFDGNNAEMIAYINLIDKLEEANNAQSLTITITDNSGRKVSETTIPLVQLNK
jgi:hypothetical protein